jgi:hypothetical protein
LGITVDVNDSRVSELRKAWVERRDLLAPPGYGTSHGRFEDFGLGLGPGFEPGLVAALSMAKARSCW